MNKNVLIEVQNKSIEKNQESTSKECMSFEVALKNLEEKASRLSGVLDNASDKIIVLEKRLSALKTNLIFKKNICKEKESLPKEPEEYHNNSTDLNVVGYYTQIWWFLSWEPDEVSKSYRLFLISEEKEFAFSRRLNKLIDFKFTTLLRKPLIETKLEIRLRFAPFLIPFMNSFEKELENYQLSIDKGENPFESIDNIQE